jgi:hypothetical protein
MFTTGDDAEEAIDHMRGHGFSDEAADKVREYALQTVAWVRDLNRQMARDLCAQRAEFGTDPEALAVEIERQAVTYWAKVQDVVIGVNDVLSDGDAIAFQGMLSHNDNPATWQIDIDVARGISVLVE